MDTPKKTFWQCPECGGQLRATEVRSFAWQDGAWLRDDNPKLRFSCANGHLLAAADLPEFDPVVRGSDGKWIFNVASSPRP